MLASVHDLLDYDLEPAPQVIAEVCSSSICALCSAKPLLDNASYAETLYWLEKRYPEAADQLRDLYAEESAEIEERMEGGRSGGDVDAPIRWQDMRRTYAYDSQLLPGYAVSVITLQIAMAQMSVDQQEMLRDMFLVALCDLCSETELPNERPKDKLLRSYVNQWAGGNRSVAGTQAEWSTLERIADTVQYSSELVVGGSEPPAG